MTLRITHTAAAGAGARKPQPARSLTRGQARQHRREVLSARTASCASSKARGSRVASDAHRDTRAFAPEDAQSALAPASAAVAPAMASTKVSVSPPAAQNRLTPATLQLLQRGLAQWAITPQRSHALTTAVLTSSLVAQRFCSRRSVSLIAGWLQIGQAAWVRLRSAMTSP
jgi:hypothetical protein